MLYFEKTISLGKIDTGFKRLANVTATIQLKTIEREQDTVDHKRVKPEMRQPIVQKYPLLTLSITGDMKRPGASDIDGGGQIYDSLKELQSSIERVKLAHFLAIWKEWHLNDLNAGCVHQGQVSTSTDNWQEEANKQTKKCPKGYRYGSQWLFKPLPNEVIDFLKTL